MLSAIGAGVPTVLDGGTISCAALGTLRAWKGTLTFETIARWSSRSEWPVSECTLRRALDGRLPTRRTILAFAVVAVHARARARGNGEGEVQAVVGTAEALWQAASDAVTRRRSGQPRAPHVPGRVTTLAGLGQAMERVRVTAGTPSLRALVAAPEAAGRLTRSALHNALQGRRRPSEQLLVAFAAACGAGQPTADALLAVRCRVQARPRPLAVYPCEIVERADERRQQDEACRPWLAAEPELDWYEQQLHDEEEAEYRRMTAWVDGLGDDELAELQAQAAAGAGRDLRAELTVHVARPRTSGASGC
ncbi:hypothetical protein P2Q00_42355 [Streptomyces coacervatus]|uniref:hypothetical protein n=1 Tax=Streptomyces coacervatus TaxID=647381 RepID=UPI0023DB5A91|nr:hypothetical protein [Streptomyces coacervatus]MDF2272009.1 hypothetical protein [Streptomyces coacervatus]